MRSPTLPSSPPLWSPSPPSIPGRPRYPPTFLHHLPSLRLHAPHCEHTAKLPIAAFPHDAACRRRSIHPPALPRTLARSLTQLLHVFIKLFAFDEVPCSDKRFGHSCTAEDRRTWRGRVAEVSASGRPSAPTGCFIADDRDVTRLGGRGQRRASAWMEICKTQ